MTNPSLSNPHHDVLTSDPGENEESRTRLIEEVKNRAKGAFGSKDLPNAELLYTRAIELSKVDDHLLFSNRAAVRLQMAKNFDALEDAAKCVILDKTFVKGHYRKITALHRLKKFSEAIKACDDAPANEEINKLKQEIVKDWEVDRKEKDEFNKEANTADPNLPPPEPTRIPTQKKDEPVTEEKKSKSSSKPKDSSLRGYKKTADGKTTSYFHTEITDEAKKLIGDCAPKKIEVEPAASEQSNNLGSAWNTAGTFEQKSYTSWFSEKITEKIDGATFNLPNGTECTLNVDSVTGDATWGCARGKIKCIQDIGVVVKFAFEMESGKKGKGKVTLENDGCDDYDEVVEVDSASSSEASGVISKYIKSTSVGLQPHLVGVLKKLVEEFKAIR